MMVVSMMSMMILMMKCDDDNIKYFIGECLKTPGWMIMNCAKSCDKHNNACR